MSLKQSRRASKKKMSRAIWDATNASTVATGQRGKKPPEVLFPKSKLIVEQAFAVQTEQKG